MLRRISDRDQNHFVVVWLQSCNTHRRCFAEGAMIARRSLIRDRSRHLQPRASLGAGITTIIRLSDEMTGYVSFSLEA